MDRPTWTFAIDVGGTFTDAIGVSSDGEQRTCKLLSSGAVLGRTAAGGAGWLVDPARAADPVGWYAGWTIEVPAGAARVRTSADGRLELDPPLGVAAGDAYALRCDEPPPLVAVRRLLGVGLDQPLGAVAIRLGTTRGTNALLERNGAAVGLVATKGFGELHLIGDQTRPHLFELAVRRPAPLVACAVELDERLAASGEVLVPLDPAALDVAIAELRHRGAESIAVSLAHAWRDPGHEAAAAAAARRAGFVHVAAGAALDPAVGLLARTETAVAEAYLAPVVRGYVDELAARAPDAQLRLLTSAGALVGARRFRAIDSVLSGPAGGYLACAALARRLGVAAAIGFDMGGTSTDVCRTGDGEQRAETLELRDRAGRLATRVRAHALAIETVAAGGGSVCRWDGVELRVGPDSAGANPGPACYGRGGPLTVTDVDLLLGRLVPERFPFPLDRPAAEHALAALARDVAGAGAPPADPIALASGLAAIVDEEMAACVRRITLARGHDPAAHALVAFGGAGGVHACSVAAALGITAIASDPLAGFLSAAGIASAPAFAHATRPVGEPLDDAALAALELRARSLEDALTGELVADGVPASSALPARRTLVLRYRGQTATLAVDWSAAVDPRAAFEDAHRRRHGFVLPDRAIEIAALRVERSAGLGEMPTPRWPDRANGGAPRPWKTQALYAAGRWHDAACYDRTALAPGDRIAGPAIVLDPGATLVIDPGWTAAMAAGGELVLDGTGAAAPDCDLAAGDAVAARLFAGRLESIALEMGEVLRASAMSTNIVERLDYSCAIFDAAGDLLVNAPHVPVHLGSMGEAVRALVARCGPPGPGQALVSNDPYHGGSHLPDVTVVSAVHAGDGAAPALYVASRAHHAEIGGIRPGSFPPDARCLAEEGVVIPPLVVSVAEGAWRAPLRAILAAPPHPSRAVDDNLADLAAQLAANRRGNERLRALIERAGLAELARRAAAVRHIARRKLARALARLPRGRREHADATDDGVPVAVAIEIAGPADDPTLAIDFTGTGGPSRNLSAPRAVAASAVLYALRCLVGEDVPLNAGLLDRVRLVVPPGLLDPPAGDDHLAAPPVVGGNVETSQRVVDVLLGALGVAAASQGTMNNLAFGNARFGYYETLGGGTGAVPGHAGESAIHSHMTNTRLADPEVLELRYPVRLIRCAIRHGSGGRGEWSGGDGMIRELLFLEPLEVSLLTQRRTRAPYGMAGGAPGAPGRNLLIRGGRSTVLDPIAGFAALPGDRLVIETPGGGGWGEGPG